MRTFTCTHCLATVPLGSGFTLDSRRLCEACTNQELAERGPKAPQPAIERLEDPTVCGRCATDWGSAALPRVAGMPMCATCAAAVHAIAFPRWLTSSLVALGVLALLTLWHHQRFLLGYLELVHARRAMDRGDMPAISRAFQAATRQVPEDVGLRGAAAFFHGAELLQANRSAEALPLLQEARRVAGTTPLIERLLLDAEAGAALDAKDYARFLEKTRAAAALDPKSSVAVAGVASALACQYAVTGEASLKQQAVAELEKAARLVTPADTERFRDYDERIRYRIESREIIDADEYHRRFPKVGSREAQ